MPLGSVYQSGRNLSESENYFVNGRDKKFSDPRYTAIYYRRELCAYLTCRLMDDPQSSEFLLFSAPLPAIPMVDPQSFSSLRSWRIFSASNNRAIGSLQK